MQHKALIHNVDVDRFIERDSLHNIKVLQSLLLPKARGWIFVLKGAISIIHYPVSVSFDKSLRNL